MRFFSPEGNEIPALTMSQMREVDRIAVEDFGLELLQMMENAGRNLAEVVMQRFREVTGPILILSGSGGNGGGGLSAARHLHNHGFEVELILAKPELGKATQSQLDVLKHAGIVPLEADETETALHEASVVVDALVGYSLSGAPRGSIAKLIQSTKKQTNAKSIISLDIPSGVDATTGETLGDAIEPTITVTLALPKTGLRSVSGDVILADIGIPREVYQSIGIQVEPFFKDQYWIPIERRQ